MTLGGRSYHANLRSTPARGTYPRFCSGNNTDCYQVETVKKFSVPASVRLFSSGLAKRNFLV